MWSQNQSTFLEQYTQALLITLPESVSFIIKDASLNFIANNLQYRLYNYNVDFNQSEISFDMQGIGESLEISRDIACMQQKKNIEVIAGITTAIGFKFMSFKKKPIIHPDTQAVLGVVTLSEELPWINNHNLITYMHSPVMVDSFAKFSFASYYDYQGISFTTREEQVLFFLLQRMTSEEISHVLSSILDHSVSPNTIKSIVTQKLNPKFGTTSTKVMINKAYEYGLQNVIPKSIVHNFSRLISENRKQIL